MTTFYLVRHGENDFVSNAIAGRQEGVHLNTRGREQAARVAESLAALPIQQIFSSPLDRARETAEPVATRLGLSIQFSAALLEANFGEWTGKTFAELDRLEEWKRWNGFRSGGQIPGGERMLDVQHRVVGEIERLRRVYPGGNIALFSHGDPLRSALVYYLAMPLDFILRLHVSPGSVSVLRITDWEPKVLAVNVPCGEGLSGAIAGSR